MCVAKDELDYLLEHKDISNRPIPILFFANKSDLSKARTVEEIHAALDLDNISDRSFTIQPSDALRGVGLHEGMKWLSANLRLHK